MPSVSAKQHRLMAAVATNPAVAKKTKIPQSVGKEFMEADKGKKFKGGGEMKESKAMVKKEIGFMKKKGAPKSMIKHEMKEAGMKKMASGGLAAGHKSADGIAHKGKTKGKEVKMALGGFAMGAVRKAAAAKAAPMLQKAAARSAASQAAPKQALPPGLTKNPSAPMQSQMQAQAAAQERAFADYQKQKAGMTGIGSQMASKPQMDTSKMGDVRSALSRVGSTPAKALMGKKAGGLAAGHKEADGIAKKGKTKAMQVKMAGGGKTKKYC